VAFDDAPISSPDGVSKAVAGPKRESLARGNVRRLHKVNT
jgi:hypothetical protein